MALTDGLIGSWSMNSDWLDASGSGHDGTAVGATFDSVNQKLGSACGSFDGVDDRVNIIHTDITNLQPPFSLAGWIKPSTTGGMVIMAGGANGWGLSIGGANQKLAFSKIDISGVSGDTVIGTVSWQLAGVTYDGATAKFYYNGSPDGTPAFISTFTNRSKAIGIRPDDLTGDFNGLMDALLLYDRIVTDAEFLELWNGGDGVELPLIEISGGFRLKGLMGPGRMGLR